MKFGKFIIIPNLVVALLIAFVIPSEIFAVENKAADWIFL